MTNKKGLRVKVGIGAVALVAIAAVWNHFSSDKTPKKTPDVTTPEVDSRGRTPEQKAVAVALAPALIGYQAYLEKQSTSLFPDETPSNAALLGKRLTQQILLEGRKIEKAFSQKDGKPYVIEAKGLKNRGPDDKPHNVLLSIDPKKGEISQTVDEQKRPAFQIAPQHAEKLREAVKPAQPLKQSFNTIAPTEDLVTVPSLAQLAAPVEAKQLPAAPAVRQITRRTGPMGLA